MKVRFLNKGYHQFVILMWSLEG